MTALTWWKATFLVRDLEEPRHAPTVVAPLQLLAKRQPCLVSVGFVCLVIHYSLNVVLVATPPQGFDNASSLELGVRFDLKHALCRQLLILGW
jgi:hypothetical protein